MLAGLKRWQVGLIVAAVVLVLAGVGIAVAAGSGQGSTGAQAASSPSPSPSSSGSAAEDLKSLPGPQPLPSSTRTTPVSVSIPAIKVSSTLQRLHLGAQGELDPPTDFVHAGWYAAGPVPGQPGPAVIAAHVDNYKGPAVFFNLKELKAGDVVSVTMSDKTVVPFAVTSVQRYPKGAFPTAAVYGATPDPQLRLITCGGSFDYSKRSYRDNIVVYANKI